MARRFATSWAFSAGGTRFVVAYWPLPNAAQSGGARPGHGACRAAKIDE